MIHQRGALSNRQTKSSQHKLYYKQINTYNHNPGSHFVIRNNQSTDSCSPQPIFLPSKTKSTFMKTNISSNKNRINSKGNSPNNKLIRFSKYQQNKQFEYLPLRTIGYLQADKTEQMLRRQTVRTQLFTRQYIQQNNQKLNELRRQKKKIVCPANQQANLSKQKQRTIVKSPIFKITSTNFYLNSGLKTATANLRQSHQKIGKQNNANFLHQNVIKYKTKGQAKNQPILNQFFYQNQDNQLIDLEQFIMSKAFMEVQTQGKDKSSKGKDKSSKIIGNNHTHYGVNPQSQVNMKSYKRNNNKKNRKSDPLHLGLYKQHKKQLTFQTNEKDNFDQRADVSQKFQFIPKLKIRKIDDNMNVLATILRKKSNILSKKELIKLIQKIIS